MPQQPPELQNVFPSIYKVLITLPTKLIIIAGHHNGQDTVMQDKPSDYPQLEPTPHTHTQSSLCLEFRDCLS